MELLPINSKRSDIRGGFHQINSNLLSPTSKIVRN